MNITDWKGSQRDKSLWECTKDNILWLLVITKLRHCLEQNLLTALKLLLEKEKRPKRNRCNNLKQTLSPHWSFVWERLSPEQWVTFRNPCSTVEWELWEFQARRFNCNRQWTLSASVDVVPKAENIMNSFVARKQNYKNSAPVKSRWEFACMCCSQVPNAFFPWISG